MQHIRAGPSVSTPNLRWPCRQVHVAAAQRLLLRQLAQSIQSYGFTSPFVVDESNIVVAGDAR